MVLLMVVPLVTAIVDWLSSKTILPNRTKSANWSGEFMPEKPYLRFASAVTALRRVMKAVFVLPRWFSVDSGHLTLSAGDHVLEVETKIGKPVEVWLSMDPHGVQVCQGSHDSMSITMLPNGFILNVTVASDILKIHWYAVCD